MHKGQLTLHDDIVSDHQNGRIVTFKPWSCLPYYVHKNDRHDKVEKSGFNKRFIGGEHDTTTRLGSYL